MSLKAIWVKKFQMSYKYTISINVSLLPYTLYSRIVLFQGVTVSMGSQLLVTLHILVNYKKYQKLYKLSKLLYTIWFGVVFTYNKYVINKFTVF